MHYVEWKFVHVNIKCLNEFGLLKNKLELMELHYLKKRDIRKHKAVVLSIFARLNYGKNDLFFMITLNVIFGKGSEQRFIF